MVQVILINSPTNFPDGKEFIVDATSAPPLGILYLAAYLQQQGVSVKILDPYPQRLSLEDILIEVENEQPVIVGISSMTPGIRNAVIIASAIKEKFGNMPYIGIGGIHASCDISFIERYSVFDFQVIGEGEITFHEIVQCVLSGEKLEKLYYGKQYPDIDDLPFVDRELLGGIRYVGPHDASEANKRETASMLATRGCPFECVFCSKPPQRKKVRNRSAKNIVDEMEELAKKYGIKHVDFIDDNIGLESEWLIGLGDEILTRGLTMEWSAQMRATDAKDEVFKKISEAGCRAIFFGIESGSERIRNRIIRKGVRDKDIINATNLCRKYGIESNFYLMMGFPTETKEDLKATGDIGIRTKADIIGIHLTKILPGSKLFDIAVNEGKIDKDITDKFIRGEIGTDWTSAWPTYIPEGLTINDLIDAKKSAYRRFYFRFGWMLQRYYSKPIRIISDLKHLRVAANVLLFGATKSAIDSRLKNL
ncbi:MAG: radical SAM protein [Candidatus Methanoperedens sp.]|nr:radical SAM protein [Candidatus Methanoperedens sp.]